jgi:hypothetical protein
MIDVAITVIADRLNQFLKNEFDLQHEEVVVVSNILELNGTQCECVDSKLAVFIVNIEREASPCQYEFKKISNVRPIHYPPLHINLYLMFASCFSGKNYPEALKFISNTISFFQKNPVFDHQNTPELDEKIEKLTLAIENISLSDLSNLWGVLSGKYMPSVLYKVRMLTFDSVDIKESVFGVRNADVSAEKR